MLLIDKAHILTRLQLYRLYYQRAIALTHTLVYPSTPPILGGPKHSLLWNLSFHDNFYQYSKLSPSDELHDVSFGILFMIISLPGSIRLEATGGWVMDIIRGKFNVCSRLVTNVSVSDSHCIPFSYLHTSKHILLSLYHYIPE